MLTCLLPVKRSSAQQGGDYQEKWAQIDSLEKQGLTRSALQVANEIYNSAQNQHNDPQQIKALIYRMKYDDQVEEDGLKGNISEVEYLLRHATQPARSVLQSMQAEMYWHYWQGNRYRLYSQTNLDQPVAAADADIGTWTAQQLQAKIAALYAASIEESELLKHTRLDAFAAIILPGKNTAALRPTLYDLLAHRALDYFESDERTVLQPADRFEISDPDAFAPAKEFAAASFVTHDSSSLSVKAIKVLQDLLHFHLQDADPAALIDADLERLNYIRQKAILENKDTLYLHALQALAAAYPDDPAVAAVQYQIALLYNERGNLYNPFSHPANRFDLAKAEVICEETLRRFPGSEGGMHCGQLLEDIRRPGISLQTEKVDLPGKPFRSLLSYRNLPAVYLRLVKLPDDTSGILNEKYKNVPSLIRLSPIAEWAQKLPDSGDHQEHSVEIKAKELPAGYYALLASADATFSDSANQLSAEQLHVSSISYLHDAKGNYFVLDRESGQPLRGIRVQGWRYSYNAKIRRNELVRSGHYVTNHDGYFKVDSARDYRSMLWEFTGAHDHLFTNEMSVVLPLRNNTNPPESRHAFLFTDRAIYRPGQRLYFKGILISTDAATHHSKVLPQEAVTVFLYNANGQTVDSLKLETNQFGSYAGSFQLPEGGLNGYMTLRSSPVNGFASFSVEAYKRPRFYVEIPKPDSTYRLDDSLHLAGTAVSYAGASLGHVKVQYHVTRGIRYPYPIPLYAYRYLPPYTAQQEIAQGSVETDASGHFTIPFKAIPDRQADSSLHPVFLYAVNVDVTDINGETQSASLTVPVGYQSLELEMDISDKLTIDSLGSSRIRTLNLSGEAVPAPVTLQVFRLSPPERFIRKRYWQQPDQFVISREDYLRDFPYDEYQDESDLANWPQKPVTTLQLSASQPMTALQKEDLAPGWYAFRASATDRFGAVVSTTRYVQLYDRKMKKATAFPSDPLWVMPASLQAESGEETSFLLGVGDKDENILLTESRMNDENKFSFLHGLKGIEEVKVPVSESDRGGILYRYMTVRHNRVYEASAFVKVPWSNKQLDIRYETFRDKMLPGSEEQWKIKISGAKGDSLSAELLASMYDASLDAFVKLNWPPLNLYPGLNTASPWNYQDNFKAIYGNGYYMPFSSATDWSYEKEYPELNWFDFFSAQRLSIIVSGRDLQDVPVSNVEQLLQGRVAGLATNMVRKKEGETVVVGYQKANAPAAPRPSADSSHANEAAPLPTVRENLNETAFFLPQLQTDAAGEVILNFTMPEALTKWRLMLMAHTQDMAYGFSEKEVITQKPLMVVPNAPRFLRQGDKVHFTAKISSLGDNALSGKASLQLLDAETLQPLNRLFGNRDSIRSFTVEAHGNVSAGWQLTVPDQFNSVVLYRVTAQTDSLDDGEQAPLPVLSNRTLVTETLPLAMQGSGEKTFRLQPLLYHPSTDTRSSYGLTVEYASNPVWYAIQALPSLTEKTNDDCAGQVFDHYYAASLAAAIAQKMPRLQAIFSQWKTSDTAALLSSLQKNQSLKNVLLEETPWVMAAKTETEQKQRLATLFDLSKLKSQTMAQLNLLQQLQQPDGSFGWFKGMGHDRYTTQSIVAGIGKLQHYQAVTPAEKDQLLQIAAKAIAYLDEELAKDYAFLRGNKTDMDKQHTGPLQVQYLYARSFFPEIKMTDSAHKAMDYYRQQAATYWTTELPYLQGMIALAASRNGDSRLAQAILRSLHETAVRNPETGLYWKQPPVVYAWYQAPVEAQALLIELWREAGGDRNDLPLMKTWLLKQKQTHQWATSSATADAVYALLVTGDNWAVQGPSVKIHLGDKVIQPSEAQQEAGTGYFQQFIKGTEVKPAMGTVKVQVQGAANASPSWGSVYWQYFEDMDKVKDVTSNSLLVSRSIYRLENTAQGPLMKEIRAGEELKIGDRVKVRILFKTDRDLDYVVLKDLRASCFEPAETISGYNWQGGMGYYRMTDDVSTRFYFDHLSQGTHVLEYTLVAAQAGNFTNGICTLQSMYAPSFSAHSEGIRVKVEAGE